MTRNQKIALGCGGAGCLGLIVVVIAACLIYFFARQPSNRAGRNYNFNVNINGNAPNANSNTSEDSNSNSSSNSNSGSTSVSSMSEDDKHKLFQAATMTGDSELSNRVNVKLGLLNDDFTPGAHYRQFLADHLGWGARNYAFIQSINTPEKARAYVNDHFPE